MVVRRRFNIRENRKYTEAMDQVLEEFGREIDLYERDTDNATDCPDCDWDSVNEESMDPNCTTCDGLGKIYPITNRHITGVGVRWFDGSGRWDRTAVGRFEAGDCRLTMMLKKVAKNPNDLSAGTYFDDAYRIVVDDVECLVKTPARPKGFRKPVVYEVIVTRSSN